MKGTSSAPSSKDQKPTSRTRIPLSTAPPVYFIPQRDPLLPPPSHPTELPMSSQSEAYSPVKPVLALRVKQEVEAVLKGKEEEEDDFDGIEDVPPSQYIPPIPRSKAKNRSVGITLDDLFSDEGNVEDMISPVTESSKKQSDGSQKSDNQRKPSPRARILSSSPIFASSSSTSKQRYYQSDTPPSPLLHTPHHDDPGHDDLGHHVNDDAENGMDEIGVEWTPSPMSQRTKARRQGGGVDLDIDIGSDLEMLSPIDKRSGRHVGEGPSSKAKPSRKTEVYDEFDFEADHGFGNDDAMAMDDFDDAGFFEGVNFDSLDRSNESASASTQESLKASTLNATMKAFSSKSNTVSKPAPKPISREPKGVEPKFTDDTFPDPGRAFRPSSTSTSTSTSNSATMKDLPFHPSSSTRQSSPPSDILAMLDDHARPDRLMLITELSTAEQEFYKNHWRRGADKSKKREQEAEWSDDGGGGPQPEKKKGSRRAPVKRGFRGRGRARGRGRGRK